MVYLWSLWGKWLWCISGLEQLGCHLFWETCAMLCHRFSHNLWNFSEAVSLRIQETFWGRSTAWFLEENPYTVQGGCKFTFHSFVNMCFVWVCTGHSSHDSWLQRRGNRYLIRLFWRHGCKTAATRPCCFFLSAPSSLQASKLISLLIF